MQEYRDKCKHLCKVTPEQFAMTHNLMLENAYNYKDGKSAVSASDKAVIYNHQTLIAPLIINLGKMLTIYFQKLFDFFSIQVIGKILKLSNLK